MLDFIKLEINDTMLKKAKQWADNKHYVDCTKHGGQTQATTLGNCVKCRNEEEFMANTAKQFLILQEHAMIPLRYRDATFSNYYPTCNKSIIFKERLMQYDYKQNLLFIGDTGCGKTHLGCALLNQALQKGMNGLYVPFYRATKYYIHENSTTFKHIINCDFLIIDEFGVQDTLFKKDLLQEIIDERYLSCTNDKFKPTLIISNLKLSPSPAQLAKDQEKGIKSTGYFIDSVADSTKSRLKESFLWLDDIDWEDYRIKKGIK